MRNEVRTMIVRSGAAKVASALLVAAVAVAVIAHLHGERPAGGDRVVHAQAERPHPAGEGRTYVAALEESAAGDMVLRYRASAKAASVNAEGLEGLRDKLHGLIDAEDEFRQALDLTAQPQDVLAAQHARIETLTLEELSLVQHALDSTAAGAESLDRLLAIADELASDPAPVASSGSAIDAVEGGPIVPDFDPVATVPALPLPTVFPSVPTPAPGSLPSAPLPPGYQPAQRDMFTGYPPQYPVVACPANSMDRLGDARYALSETLLALEAVSLPLQYLCKGDIEVLGFEATNVVTCPIGVIATSILVGFSTVLDTLDFCAGLINSAEIEAGFENSGRIMARLIEHDAYMQQSFENGQTFLQDLERSVASEAMGRNLASSDDAPVALFLLPESVCRELPGPENDVRYTLPDGSVVGPRRQCGLIEEIDRTVASLRNLVAESGLGTNNADAELAAARALKSQGEYKAAYARYRNAYRELASTHSVP